MNVGACFIYLLLCALRIKFLNSNPEDSRPHATHVVHFSDKTLEETLKHDNRITWVIEAFTTWSSECSEFASVFADLSLDYGHEFLRFGKIDVGKYDELAKQYCINISPMSKQLPTTMIIKGNKVLDRRPTVLNGKLVKFINSYENLERELDFAGLYNIAKKTEGKAKLPKFVPAWKVKNQQSTESKKDK